MASSHNLASIDPCWTLRNLTTFPDSFFPHTFSCDYEFLTKSLSGPTTTTTTTSDTVPPFLNNLETTPSSTVSDQETRAPKRHRNSVVSATGKVSKRKSRASKRSQTTYISADPLNFRQMVQQVTGVKPDNSHVPMARILKPEPHRARTRLPLGDLFLPTLDTSSPFLLDRKEETPTAAPDVPQPALLSFEPPLGALDHDALDFDAYLDFPTHFPTLESWKVM